MSAKTRAAHTPGPWKVYRSADGRLLGIGDAEGGGITDSQGGLWLSGDEMEANANLIASAPDLLLVAELLLCAATIEIPAGLINLAESAVAKAKAAA